MEYKDSRLWSQLYVTSVAVNPCNLSINTNPFAAAFFFRWIFMASAIKKILLKKNAAGKSGLGFIFDERDNKNILLFIITIHCCPETFSQNSYY